MKVSIDLEDLLSGHPIEVSSENIDMLKRMYLHEVYDGKVVIGNLSFFSRPSIAAELDRLLAQRVKPSTDDRFVMSRKVWQRYCEEKLLTPKSLDDIKIYERLNYRGVFIETQDEIDGGVRLKCDYYVKGNL